ncbi:hypothetical protein [Nonomuraea roseoviolacea]|uniref:MftR C-terminal domain-containing protein n=2 Tax=Nonomuraea TaxID=83681 RepID=A0ABT1K1K1_9ACTN|nr:hypothetical protein [Nonomuraea roseoviolacea]MCP2347547.1 hypothetical protein [Nonomuraea roseoviolacea subsp. carminata]
MGARPPAGRAPLEGDRQRRAHRGAARHRIGGPLPDADLERDLYPRLVAGTVGVAISASTELWLRLGPPASYGELLQDALDQVTRGLPLPTGPASGRSG